MKVVNFSTQTAKGRAEIDSRVGQWVAVEIPEQELYKRLTGNSNKPEVASTTSEEPMHSVHVEANFD